MAKPNFAGRVLSTLLSLFVYHHHSLLLTLSLTQLLTQLLSLWIEYLWFSRSASFVHQYTGPLKPYDDGFKAMFVMDVVYGKHYLNSFITESEEVILFQF